MLVIMVGPLLMPESGSQSYVSRKAVLLYRYNQNCSLNSWYDSQEQLRPVLTARSLETFSDL